MPDRKSSTKLIGNHTGGRLSPSVNPPVERASTLLFDDRASLYGSGRTYGRMGLAVHRELEAALCDLEGGVGAQLTPNGLSSCTLAIAACIRSGDHVLVTDCVYGPTRRFCTKRLRDMGVETSFFDPTIGTAIEDLIRENTTVIFLESPGSLTFEISDLPVISTIAKARGITVIVDNTWGAGVYYKPLLLGADISVQALTKYVVGHADAFGGSIVSADPAHEGKVRKCAEQWGISIGPDDAYLALRGLRTLVTRLKAHEAGALEIAALLANQEAISSVLHPALEGAPGHEIWARDFTGSCGLFSIVLSDISDAALDAFLSGFEILKFGFSWGGYESLLNPADDQFTRLYGEWSGATRPGRLVRVHIGLEHTSDLIADFERAFGALRTHLSS